MRLRQGSTLCARASFINLRLQSPLGAEYLEHLSKMFPEMIEPVAASYNGGEDNVARWLKRSKRKDPGVFTSEVGFDETKGYVQKVMSNYRVYRKLYTADLIRR